ncbi:Ubiquitin carboxyl-terminal hydrolase 23 [Dichanthelium oligosanthes]|uniref:Ubiquitin carboxyl-terminal hydrolase 23 n=1 Tax=Dichanthelium oligosanthes TaxID=888268 RepID=A0A1E5W6J4_9POAL|nr:Ubiquitin carboxyl-terminal hydrolase 23 [Dichanthelium oligosanthes]
MGEAAAAVGLLHRRIEFHAATKPSPATAAAVAVPGGFRMERMLFAGADKRVAAERSGREDRRFESGESSGSGFDPELSAARFYLRRIGAGLHNLGNTCYLNSVLQCLTYTEPFVAYLQSSKHKSSCRTAGFCALCALQIHVRSALRSTGKILTPMLFVKNLRCILSCISRSFRNSRQEDAHELMVSLLESMHKSCLPSGIPSESPSAYEKSLVHRIFGGRLRSQVRCTRCSHCSNKFDPFLDLSLEIGNAITLVKALHNFTKEELLDGGEKHYNCQQCKQKVVAKKRFLIDKAPSVLTVHLKRFSPFNPLQKIDKKVDFQTTLNLKPFVSNSEVTDLKYSLYGVLVHAGWNTQSGHYYCFVRTSSGLWHNLDDNQVGIPILLEITYLTWGSSFVALVCIRACYLKNFELWVCGFGRQVCMATRGVLVRQVREADVLKQKAYMLFYVRDKVRSSVIHEDNGAASLSEEEMISEKIACMKGAIRNGLVEKTLDFSPIVKEDMKLQKLDPDNGQPIDISATTQDQCSNEHCNVEVINALTSRNNEPVQKASHTLPDGVDTLSTKAEQIALAVQRETMSPGRPDGCILDMKSLKLNPDNGQRSNISATSQDQYSNEHGSTEVTEASTSQNTEPIQKATCSQHDSTATFSTKTEQIAPASQRETTSTEQSDACIICDARSDHKAHEKPLQEFPEEPDGALTDSGKDIPASAFQLCNGVDGLLGANEQANEPQIDVFSKPTPDSDATTIAPVIPTEDTAVSNEAIAVNEDSTNGNNAKGTEPVKQHDGLVVMKELPVKNIDDKVKAEEQIYIDLLNTNFAFYILLLQTAVRNNTLGDVQSTVKEVSIMETGHMADAEDQTSVQNDSLDTGHVNCEKKICSEDSAHVASSEDCAQEMCSENSVQVVDKDPCHGNLRKNIEIKSKKHVKYPAANFYFGSKQLLLASLKLHKKRKHKRTRKRSTSDANAESIADDQQTSTSETLTSGISCKSHRQKRSCNTASSEDAVQMYNKEQNLGDSCAAELTMDKKGSKDATLDGAELASSCPRSVSNPDAGKCGGTDEKGSWHFNLLTRGLRVPRWDDDDMPNTKATKLQYLSSTSIGYVLDERDEEYDRGSAKKVRKSKRGFSGPNPFQEMENIKARQRRRLTTN